MGAGQLTRSQMNSTYSSEATVFRSNYTSHTNCRAVKFCTEKETSKRKKDCCHLMTMLFGKSLGFQEAKSSKDAKQALEFCSAQNAEAFHLFDLNYIPCFPK